jgi:hypothetical protein
MVVGGAYCALLLLAHVRSRKRCLRAAGQLIWQAGEAAGLSRRQTKKSSSEDAIPKSGRAASAPTKHLVPRAEAAVEVNASKA